ncbi:MAG: hypothetical protein PVG89_05745 [Gammaproteobacteria bacterium]|jgi:hypothetical protein
MRGCGCTLALVTACLSLAACSSDEASLEVQYQSEINEVLETLSNNEPFRQDLAALPESNKLTREHIITYVWIKASAMKLVLAEYVSSKQGASPAASNKQMVKTSKEGGEIPAKIYGSYGIVSSVERKVLDRLEYDIEIYARIKDTVEVTLDFIDAVDNPEVVALVSKHDPAIKANLSLVEDAKHLLETVNRYPIDRFVTRSPPSQQT